MKPIFTAHRHLLPKATLSVSSIKSHSPFANIARGGGVSDRTTSRPRRWLLRVTAAGLALLPCGALADQAVSIIQGGATGLLARHKVDGVAVNDSASGLSASVDVPTAVLKASADADGQNAPVFSRVDASFTVDELTIVAPSGAAAVPVVMRVDAVLSGTLGPPNLGGTFHNRVMVSIEGGEGVASVDYTYEKSATLGETRDVFPLAAGNGGYTVLDASASNFSAVVRTSIVPGRASHLTCSLLTESSATIGCKASTDASHTAKVTIDLPPGYQIRSRNGRFLSAQSPVAGSNSRLVNVSVRSSAGTDDQTLIMGFVIGGSGSRSTLVRGIGPTLAALNVTGPLADPRLLLFSGASGATPMQQNDDWGAGAPLANAFKAVGAFDLPPASKDAALLVTLAPGNYTAHITSSSGTGVALTEVYDAEPSAGSARLANVSTRSRVGTDADILIVGFAIAGTGSKTVLIRGVGPSLAPFGVSGLLANPRLQLFSGSALFAENDDWGGNPALMVAFAATNAFALLPNSADAALVATLAPGAYTAQVSGVGNTTGVALLEVYEVP